MFNPFQMLTDAFREHYRVNFSLESPDGSIMLTLSDSAGVVAKRLISPAQRNDAKRLENLIQSIRFGIAIDSGQSPNQVLLAMHSTAHVRSRTVPGQVCHQAMR
jgi:hypothetical protein